MVEAMRAASAAAFAERAGDNGAQPATTAGVE